jgi:alkanesulfonate monooxygenase SsuD/methylene tetrahydromethanopterin reductase-like flavin-dependent oxidoreductase (luciferase family)
VDASTQGGANAARRLIRTLGFDSIWGGKHHVTAGFHYFPLLAFLQRLAAEGDGLWLGTNVVLLALHNPVEVAEIGAFLDVITGGRFLLGVGRPWATGRRSSPSSASRWPSVSVGSSRGSRSFAASGPRTGSPAGGATGSSTG